MIAKMITRIFNKLLRGLSLPERQDAFTILLGLIGLVLLAYAYPFGWEMPHYAAY